MNKYTIASFSWHTGQNSVQIVDALSEKEALAQYYCKASGLTKLPIEMTIDEIHEWLFDLDLVVAITEIQLP